MAEAVVGGLRMQIRVRLEVTEAGAFCSVRVCDLAARWKRIAGLVGVVLVILGLKDSW